MYCCQNCFDNNHIKKIFENKNIGKCDYCQSEEVRIIDSLDQELSGIVYRCLMPFKKNAHGQLLSRWLTSQFNLFNASIDVETINRLLSDMSQNTFSLDEKYAFKLYDIGVESELLNLWIEFKEGLKHKSRFAFTLNPKLKDALLNIMEINLVVIEENSIFYRARNGAPSKFSAYKEKDIMCPPKELVGNGRINSKGIPYLYTASDAETAIAEVRPSKAVPVSVAKLATTKSHRFVKLDNVKFSTVLPLYIQYELYQLANVINSELSKPIDASTSDFGYLATQFIAELADSKGFEGLAFKSSLAEGTNYVFFLEDNIKFVDSEIFDVVDIKYVTQSKNLSLSALTDEDFKF